MSARIRFCRTRSRVARAAGEPLATDAAVALFYLLPTRSRSVSDEQIAHDLKGAITVLEKLGDEAALARALSVAGMVRFWRGEAAAAITDLEQAARYARQVGDRAQEAESLQYALMAMLWGPTPVDDALKRLEDIRRGAEANRRLEVALLRTRAQLEAMHGRFDAARDLIAQAKALAEEVGLEIPRRARRLPGRLRRTARRRCRCCRTRAAPSLRGPRADGETGNLATVAPKLADALVVQGSDEEALRLTELAERFATPEDADAEIRLAARAGEAVGASGRRGRWRAGSP